MAKCISMLSLERINGGESTPALLLRKYEIKLMQNIISRTYFYSKQNTYIKNYKLM